MGPEDDHTSPLVADACFADLAGAAIAEFFADILLTPLEAVRIRLVSDRTYASGLAPGFVKMAKEGGVKELYAGFIPILVRTSRSAPQGG